MFSGFEILKTDSFKTESFDQYPLRVKFSSLCLVNVYPFSEGFKKISLLIYLVLICTEKDLYLVIFDLSVACHHYQ